MSLLSSFVGVCIRGGEESSFTFCLTFVYFEVHRVDQVYVFFSSVCNVQRDKSCSSLITDNFNDLKKFLYNKYEMQRHVYLVAEFLRNRYTVTPKTNRKVHIRIYDSVFFGRGLCLFGFFSKVRWYQKKKKRRERQ